MASYYTFLALELARDRAAEADRRNRFLIGENGFAEATPGMARRTLARAAAVVSRGSAALAHRLDESVAADTGVRSSRLA
jgi:hypothetical protein